MSWSAAAFASAALDEEPVDFAFCASQGESLLGGGMGIGELRPLVEAGESFAEAVGASFVLMGAGEAARAGAVLAEFHAAIVGAALPFASAADATFCVGVAALAAGVGAACVGVERPLATGFTATPLPLPYYP